MRFPTAPVKSVADLNPETLGEETDRDVEYAYAEISDVAPGLPIRWQEPRPFEQLPSRARRLARNGDVVVSTVRTYLRAVARVDNAPDHALVSTGFAVFRPRIIEPRYLGYALQSADFVDAVVARSVGVSYPAISASDVARIHVPVPSYADQRQIADYLDRETAEIDEFIADLAQLAKVVAERVEAINEMAFAAPANSIPLRRVVSAIEAGTSVNATDTLRLGTEPAVLKTSAVYEGRFDPNALKPVWPEEMGRLTSPVRAGRLLVSRMNTARLVGDAAVVPEGLQNVYIPDRLWQIETTMDVRFLHAWTRTRRYRQQVVALAVGASPSMKTLAREDFLSMKVPAMSLTRQQQVARAFAEATLDQKLAMDEIGTAVALATERRAALITSAVTGQIDVAARQKPVVHSIQTAIEEAR